MRPIIIVSFMLLLVMQPSMSADLKGKVIGVSDGDTVTVLSSNRQVKVRLASIDCPEKGQPQAERAKQFTSRLCFGKKITVEESGRDRYGRTVGIVKLANGKSVNRELIRSGYAWVYRQYASDPNLLELESAAKSKRRGLWKDPEPVAPWVFRRSSVEER